jgi:phospholipid/cholesterol/gamma-HCH transport system substrate-binding protein
VTPTRNRQAVIVGLFVAVAVAILAGGILTIGNINDTFTKKILITAVFDEVSGLQQGDNVWFSGVKVGIVKELGLQDGSKVEVRMKIDNEVTKFIHADALAKIGSDGLIGNKIVVIYGGTPTAPEIQDGDILAIGKTVSSEEIMATLQQNNNNLLAITTSLKGISGRIASGEGTVGKLLGEDALYEQVSGTVTTLGKASDNARSLTASASTFAAKLNREGSLPNQLVTDKTTYASLTTTVDHLQHAGERASDLMDGLAKGASDPNTPVGTMMRDQEAGTDVKATLDNLNKSSALLAEDLEAAQHNFLLRPFFKKKAKAEAEAKDDAAAADPAEDPAAASR